MGMVNGFEHDVFISYAHIDNVPYGPRQTCWVDEFAQVLERRLAMLTGSSAAIWRDPRLRGNQVLWPTIQQALAASATLVAVISPRYISSESCQQEWSWFDSAATPPGSTAPQNPVRLLHVVKLPVDRPMLPRPLQDQLGYEFFTIDEQTGDANELERSSPRYFTKINALARDIQDLLGRMNAARAARSSS